MRHTVFGSIIAATLLSLVTLPSLAAPIELPNMGDSSARVLTPAHEQRLGEGAYHQLRRGNYLLDDPEANDYLQMIGETIASGSNQPAQEFRFFIVNDSTLNAFAMPGGYIGMNTGLIIKAESEHELGGVLAHEITHVTQKHIARIIEATQPYDYATAALVLAAIVLSGGDPEISQAALSIGLAGAVQQQINFTRAHESEADRVGIHLLAKAGLDPKGMAQFFERIDKQNRNYGTRRAIPEFLRTHPVTNSRITEANTRAKQYSHLTPTTSELFELMRERVRVLNYKSPNEAVNYYTQDQSAPPTTAMRYGHAIALLQSGQNAPAQHALKILLDENPNNLYFHLGHAHAALNNRQNQLALNSYATTHELFPESTATIIRYADALLQLNQPQHARNILQKLNTRQRDNPSVHRLFARSAADLNLLAETHLHTVDYYLSLGDKTAAREQLKTALLNKNITPIERQRLKSRQNTLDDDNPKRRSTQQQIITLQPSP